MPRERVFAAVCGVKLLRAAGGARAAGAVPAALERAGTPIGAYDTLPVGQAIRRGLVPVTANDADFARVSGLTWQNWPERTFRRRRRLPHLAAPQGGLGQWGLAAHRRGLP